MNNFQRKEIKAIISKVETLRDLIEEIKETEQEKLDNTPENLQGSERFATMEEDANLLEYALDNLSECIDNLDNIS